MRNNTIKTLCAGIAGAAFNNAPLARAARRDWEMHGTEFLTECNVAVGDSLGAFAARLHVRLMNAAIDHDASAIEWLSNMAPTGMSPERTRQSTITHVRRLIAAVTDGMDAAADGDGLMRRLQHAHNGCPPTRLVETLAAMTGDPRHAAIDGATVTERYATTLDVVLGRLSRGSTSP
jgi:hypothetical protein